MVQHKDDPTVVNAMREAAKRILYTVANSNAMNGVSANMQVMNTRTDHITNTVLSAFLDPTMPGP